MTRIAIIGKEKCKPEKCSQECISVCPINRKSEKCIILSERSEDKREIAQIDESLCIGCGLCIKKCPFKAVEIANLPEQLKEIPIHRFGKNQFVLYRLPYPVKGEVVGLLGPNGVGKTTALKILSGQIDPNLGNVSSERSEEPIRKPARYSSFTGPEKIEKEIIKIFRGTEIQNYLENLFEHKIKAVVKPQQIDVLSKLNQTPASLLEKYNERNALKHIVKELSLSEFLDRKLSQLSGGELQRIAVAIALARKADVYYFDEPSSYLDVFQRLKVAKLIRELAKESAVMVVEHDLATLDLMADKIHVFYGAPGIFGIVSKPYTTRNGINDFLRGFIKEDNVRIRDSEIDFKLSKSSTTQSEVYLQWTDLKKQLGEFSLEVSSGNIYKSEILGIFGANALGKTTFAKILAGELEQDSGEIDKKVKISYKPQYISSDFKGTVYELINSTNVSAEEFRSIAHALEIERLFESKVSNLSGGELQRVSIALCLSKDCDLFLMDEPSAFLDSEQRLAVAKLIRKICETKEKSSMIIDHDLLFLSYLSDRALLFSGVPSLSGKAVQMDLQTGFNEFLKQVSVTFRKDKISGRPRANKPFSQKDSEQKQMNKYFYVE